VRDADAVALAMQGCHGVVHLAGWVHRMARGAADVAELRSSIIDGTAVVARAAAAVGARFVMTSSIAACRPQTAYGQAKLEAEQRARTEYPQAIVLRPAVVYGPHDHGNVAALIHAVEKRFGFVVGDGRNRKSMVYAANLADRIVAVLARDDLAGVWVASDDPAPTQGELFTEISRALGRRPPRTLPRWPLATVAAAVDLVARTHFRDRVNKLTESTEFPGTALDRALGYAPRVPWPDGLHSTIGRSP
jgi:nucleoside-diphosphate-sugar epimerase